MASFDSKEMPRKWLRRCSVFLLLLGWSSGACAQEAPLPAPVTGTFLQLWHSHHPWSQEEWTRLFEYFRELRLSRLIVQWSLFDDTAFYPSAQLESSQSSPLETILRLADETGMKVLIGTAHDTFFWKSIEREPELVEIYLRRSRLRSQSILREVEPLVKDAPSFEGWYISSEIDDIHWLEPERRKILFEYLSGVSADLREKTPEAKVAISGFSNGHADPETLARFWAELINAAGVDIVLFQDGIGVAKLDLRHLPVYLGAMREAVTNAGRDLWIVVENFRQTAGAPLNEQPFEAAPAPMERLRRQLEIASRFSTGEIIAFSVPEYMTPMGGKDAGRLFEVYRSRLLRSP